MTLFIPSEDQIIKLYCTVHCVLNHTIHLRSALSVLVPCTYTLWYNLCSIIIMYIFFIASFFFGLNINNLWALSMASHLYSIIL